MAASHPERRGGTRRLGALATAVGSALVATLWVGSPAAAHTGAALDVDPLHFAGVPPAVERVVGSPAFPARNGLFEVVLRNGETVLTHGPDAPQGDSGATWGGSTRSPACATDYYQHVLYGRLRSKASRYGSVKSDIQSMVKRMNGFLNKESLRSGGPHADYKVLCDSRGIRVGEFVSEGRTLRDVVDGARAAGFNRSNADYTIFFDARGPDDMCGVATMRHDERLTAANRNNEGGGYGIAYRRCWHSYIPMHENGHNQGAVQYYAPSSTGSGTHCAEEEDVMCYTPDGGDKHQHEYVHCDDVIHYDCRWNDYFDAAPRRGEYLYTHWNIGSRLNRFIRFGSR
jgi:hypothetical protein